MTEPVNQTEPVDPVAVDETELSTDEKLEKLETLVAERTEDLQRLQAEYVNYKRRVDRDRAQARQGGIEAVLGALMPVFDSIVAAEAHDDLTGGFKLTADELVKVTDSFGFARYGEAGDEFDPHLHEALMQEPVPGTGEMTIKSVLQVGYRLNDLVLRPARVIVAVPDGSGDVDTADEAVTTDSVAEDETSGDELDNGDGAASQQEGHVENEET